MPTPLAPAAAAALLADLERVHGPSVLASLVAAGAAVDLCSPDYEGMPDPFDVREWCAAFAESGEMVAALVAAYPG